VKEDKVLGRFRWGVVEVVVVVVLYLMLLLGSGVGVRKGGRGGRWGTRYTKQYSCAESWPREGI
jgi:hypothetical protein